MKLCMNEIMFCLRSAGFTGPDLVTGGAVGMAESQGETDAIGRVAGSDNEDLGLMQISTKWHEAKIISLAGVNWRDPLENCRLALQVHKEFASRPGGGWTAWAVFNKPDPTKPASYEQWLPMARNAESGLWAPTPDGATLIWNRRLAS